MAIPRVTIESVSAPTAGGETQLPGLEPFRAAEPVSAKVLNHILLGVSTSTDEKSLDGRPRVRAEEAKAQPARHLVARMTARMNSAPTAYLWLAAGNQRARAARSPNAARAESASVEYLLSAEALRRVSEQALFSFFQEQGLWFGTPFMDNDESDRGA